jgi:hypothetical protein
LAAAVAKEVKLEVEVAGKPEKIDFEDLSF